METWLKKHSEGATLSLYIQPGASKDELFGIHDGRLKLKIKAPPRDGEANARVIEFLGKLLQIPKKKIFLIHGESSRQKTVLVLLSPEEVLTLLQV